MKKTENWARWLWFVMVALCVLTAGCGVEKADVAGNDEQVEATRTEVPEGEANFDVAAVSSPTMNATACMSNPQCPTGFCVDGYCCDSKCDNKCMACSAAKKGSGVDGICGSIKYDTDPDNDCAYGACDGKNMCKNYNGFSCTAAAQCLSNYCVDGFCCNNICMGSCQACSAAKKGSGQDGICGAIKAAMDPDNECSNGDCNGSGACSSSPQPTFPNGTACTSAASCASGYCADGVCCDSWCLGTCQACTAAKKNQGSDGTCGNIANDKDPDEECWGGACNGTGMCKQYNGVLCTDKTQCLSGYCIDGFCCGNICTGMCQACSAGKKGQGYDGVCGSMASGRDPDNECNPGECNGLGACNQAQTPQANGTACASSGQCASGFCVDGVCCDSACTGTCRACSTAKKGNGVNGTCGVITSETDPDAECNGGRCDGSGACRFYNGVGCVASTQCFSNFCVDGFCCNNACLGGCTACSAVKKGQGSDGVCSAIATGRDPDNECNPGECNGSSACNQTQAQSPNGTTCTYATQCTSGFCIDGVCCDSGCATSCVACSAARKGQGTNGICGFIKVGTDPDNECTNGECNGSGACMAATNVPNGGACAAGSSCMSGYCVDGVCCDNACTGSCRACSAAKKGSGSDGTCGVIRYDSDPDEECHGGACDGTGACKQYNGLMCTAATQCLSGYCVDGFCCGNHCGGTCYACSAAKKGSGYDGVCGPIGSTRDPDGECPGAFCNGAGACKTAACTSTADCPMGAMCTNNLCVCNAGYSGNGITCTEIDECATNNGGCSTQATCTNTPGSYTCTCNAGYAGDGVTCTDIDECATNNGGCGANGTCTNTPGSYSCSCPAGHTLDGGTCVDIDECATNNGGCHWSAICTNTPGSYTCTCPPYWEMPEMCGVMCTDLSFDTRNCGTCGHVCPSPEDCHGGICHYPWAWANWPMPNSPGSGLPNPASYTVDASNGLVVDSVTHLMWQRDLDSLMFTQDGAVTYCKNLVYGGYSDWRLPTRIELLSIVDDHGFNPAIDTTAFPNTPIDYAFWTSSGLASYLAGAWVVGFGGAGYPGTRSHVDLARARCVR